MNSKLFFFFLSLIGGTAVVAQDWWSTIESQFSDSSPPVHKCKKRKNVAPTNSSVCGKEDKICFFGDQLCPQGSYPNVRCACESQTYFEKGTWTCVPEPCPTENVFALVDPNAPVAPTAGGAPVAPVAPVTFIQTDPPVPPTPFAPTFIQTDPPVPPTPFAPTVIQTDPPIPAAPSAPYLESPLDFGPVAPVSTPIEFPPPPLLGLLYGPAMSPVVGYPVAPSEPPKPTASPAPTITAPPSVTPSVSSAPSIGPCSLCGDDNNTWTFINYYATVNVTALGGMIDCWYLHDYANYGAEYYGYKVNATLTCQELQMYGEECGCPPTEPTASPAPTISSPPSLTPSISAAPSAAPCSLCGDENTTWMFLNYSETVNVTALGGMVDCWYLHDFAYYGAELYSLFYGYKVNATLTCQELQMYGEECGCPPTEPTASPAPTTSAPPSLTPSVSPAPSAGPCFLCGDESSTWSFFNYSETVNVTALGGVIDCWHLQDYALYGSGYYYDYNGGKIDVSLTCEEIQVFGEECGCPPTEPTASPAPTISAPPSLTPSISPAPSAGPCFLCGDESSTSSFLNYSETVNVTALGGMIGCGYLRDYALYDFGYYNNYNGGKVDVTLTCQDLQLYGEECGCPPTEPTASPAPTISSPPSVTPTKSLKPSGECSCQDLCGWSNFKCSCYCDSVCEGYGDCCGDVSDHCKFDDTSVTDTAGDDVV